MDAINAAGNQRRKWKKRGLDLSLCLRQAAHSGRNRGRSLRRGNDRCGSARARARFLSNRGSVDTSIRGHRQRGDFTLRSFVKDESVSGWSAGLGVFAATLSCSAGDAQDAAVGFGPGDEILVGIEREDANVGFVARIRQFALAVGCYREKLSFVSGSNVQCAIGREGQVPNVFCLGIKKYGLLA